MVTLDIVIPDGDKPAFIIIDEFVEEACSTLNISSTAVDPVVDYEQRVMTHDIPARRRIAFAIGQLLKLLIFDEDAIAFILVACLMLPNRYVSRVKSLEGSYSSLSIIRKGYVQLPAVNGQQLAGIEN
jgi:hypothetical protein